MIEFLLTTLAAAATAGFGGPAGIWDAIVQDFSNITEPAAFAAFLQVLMIDLVLAGDNAIVVGALAAGLTPDQRRKVIMIGVLAALVLRIAFALVVTQLLQIIGLILVGGLLLLWVAWKMWRELRHEGEVWRFRGDPGRRAFRAEAREELRRCRLGRCGRGRFDEPRQRARRRRRRP